MGLFDFDPNVLANIFGPSAAQAANTMSPESPLTTDQLIAAGQSRLPQPSPVPAPPAPSPTPIQGEFANPNPVPAGGVPLPRPFPGVQDLGGGPATVPGTMTLNRGATPAEDVGAGLTGQTSSGRQPGGGSASSETAPSDANAQAPESGLKRPDANTLAGALRGVKAPEAPQPQKISSPNAPHLNPLRGGNLAALLALLNAGGGRGLPTTLGRG